MFFIRRITPLCGSSALRVAEMKNGASFPMRRFV
jgi:hypothetical protein